MSFLSRSNAQARRFLRQVRSFLARPRLIVQQTPVILDESEFCDNPIFLIGVHRSGTSLTRRMFNRHAHIACPPETFFLQHYATIVAEEECFAGFRGMGFERPTALKELRRAASRFHEAFRKAEGKPRWADKTPQYVFCADALAELFGPEARFVVIFRHPFDIVTSIYHRGWRKADFAEDLFENTVHYVADAHARQLAFLARHPDQARPLFYESLCQAPEATLTELLAWLGEPWDPQMLDFAGGRHNQGTEDPMIRGLRTIELNLGTWKTLSPAQIAFLRQHLGSHAEALGYSTDLATIDSLDGGKLALPKAA